MKKVFFLASFFVCTSLHAGVKDVGNLLTAAENGTLREAVEKFDGPSWKISNLLKFSGIELLVNSVSNGYSDNVIYLFENLRTTPEFSARSLSAISDGSGKTLLHHARLSGNDKIYNLLVDWGLNPKAVDIFGRTPDDMKCFHQYTEAMARLRE